jgi:hypothetical protein
MKIAIPTNDGLSVSPNFKQARGFLILTLELGEIIREDLKWKTNKDIPGIDGGHLNPINDCQAVMVHDNDPAFFGVSTDIGKEIIRTRESIITNACMHFLENTFRNEANTCCCP